jgi:threonine dehydrogenase-like Zn-dependent dehydrogenase
MRALKYYGDWKVALEEVASPRLTGPDDVIVDVEFCGICGTDVGIVSGYYPVAVSGVTLGHEATGIVSAVGDHVTNVAIGDRVVVNPTPYCGTCRMCRTGRINHCVNKFGSESGVSADGAFADQYRTTSQFVHRIPEGVSLQAAALTEPLSCVVAGVNKLHPPTMTALTYVLGAGPLGVLYAWALSVKGLVPAVVETSPARLDFANSCLPQGVRAYPSLAAARCEHFGDAEAPLDVVVDTTSGLLEEIYPQLACGGTFLSIGLKQKMSSINTMYLADRSLSVIGSIDSVPGSFIEAFHLITSGQIPTQRLVSHVIPLTAHTRGFAAVGCDIDGGTTGPIDEASCKVLLATARSGA